MIHVENWRFVFWKGDVLCICMNNCFEYPLAVYAVLSLGGIVTTCNPLNVIGGNFSYFSWQDLFLLFFCFLRQQTSSKNSCLLSWTFHVYMVPSSCFSWHQESGREFWNNVHVDHAWNVFKNSRRDKKSEDQGEGKAKTKWNELDKFYFRLFATRKKMRCKNFSENICCGQGSRTNFLWFSADIQRASSSRCENWPQEWHRTAAVLKWNNRCVRPLKTESQGLNHAMTYFRRFPLKVQIDINEMP